MQLKTYKYLLQEGCPELYFVSDLTANLTLLCAILMQIKAVGAACTVHSQRYAQL